MAAIRAYNTQIDACVSSQIAFRRTMMNASEAAKSMVERANGNTVALNNMTKASKAAELGMKALSIASNMILFAAITEGIALVVKGFDNWIHRIEKANEAMNEAVSEYESTKSSLESINSELEENNKKIDVLLAKDKLTYAEKGQLEELQAITNELLLQQDIEEKRANNASKEAADKAVNAYNKQYGKYDKTEDELKEKLSYENFPMPESEDDVLGTIAAYIQAKESLEQSKKDYEEALKNGEDTTWLTDDLQLNIDTIEDYSQVLDESILDLQEKRVALENEYNKVIEKRESGVEPLTTSDKKIIETYESIYDVIRMIYKYTDQNAWNSMEISNILTTEGIEKTKNELIDMAQAGELTLEKIREYPNLNDAIENSDLFLKNSVTAAEAFCDEIYACADATREMAGSFSENNISFTEAISQVEALSKGFDQLDKIYADVSNKEDFDWSSILNNEAFQEAFGDMENVTDYYKDVYDKFIESVSNSPKDLNGCQKAFNDLATAYIMNSGILDNVTEKTKSTMAAMLEQMGIANAMEVVEGALTAKHIEQALALESLDLANLNAINTTYGQIGALLEEADASAFAISSLYELVAQETIYNNTSLDTTGKIQALEKLGRAFGVTADSSYTLQAAQNAALKAASSFSLFPKPGEDPLKYMSQVQKAANDAYEASYVKISDYYTNAISAKYSSASYTGSSATKSAGRSGSGSSASGSGSASQSIETFNFIEIAITRIEEAIDKLKTKAEETFRNFTTRGKAYASSISQITKEISLQEQAYNAYMARANSYGLNEAWAAQVRDGSINIADVANNGLKEQISGYKEWYEKAHECQEALEELKKTQKELAQEKIELLVTKYDKLLSRLEARMDKIEYVIDYKETWGRLPNKGNYNSLNKNLQSQISYTIKQNTQLSKLKKTVEKGSEAWYEYNERITSNNQSIQELTESMAKNATTAASLAGQKAEQQNDREDKMDETIDGMLSTAPTASRKNNLINRKLNNINDRQANLKKAYTTTKNARVSYANKILSATKKGVSSTNKKLFASAKSCVKKKKLIPASLINKIVSAMKSATGAQYNSLNKLLSYCNSYNANKNAEDENRQLYEMYVLTAQADKAKLRQEQLQNNLDKNQTKADRSTITAAETTTAKNHNLDVQIRQNNADASSYETAAKNAASDRKKAGKKANFSSDKSYKNLKDKALKVRLKKAISAIKAGTKIDSDSLKAVKEYCSKYLNGNMTYYDNCRAYNSAVENELGAQEAETLAKAEAYAANLQARREKAANTVAGRDTQNELYSATAANQTTAKAKNSYVDKQIANLNSSLETYKTDYHDAVTDYNTAKSAVTKISSADKSKQSIINTIKTNYVNKNILIPAKYIEKAYTVSNAFGLACVNYNEALESKNTAQETYNLYEQTSQTEKAALALEKMANIKSEYSNKQSAYEQRSQRLNNAIELAQAKGYEVSKVYYNKLIQEESAVNSSLAAERQALMDSLDESVANGTITKYSDEWYEMCANIDDVTNSLDESTKSLVEFQNQLRQIEWDHFDYLENHIKNVTSEISFLIDELSREDLASDDTGQLTDLGNAVAVLRSASYESYQKQAKDYADEISRIDEDLAKDENKYNKTLLERREELVQSYQDCVKGAQDEKYAIIELYEQGYDALLAKIKKLISEYENLLDAKKDAYDYQNDIADKTGEIANLQKQLQAYAGDISEETRAKVQTLKVSLEEAEKDLAQTQYEKYISDTKEMLSDLEADLEEAIQAIIDSLSENFDELLKGMDSYYQEACDTITEVSTGIGYTPTEEFQNLLDDTSIASAVTSMLMEIENFHKDMTGNADDNANATVFTTVFTNEAIERLMGLNQAIMPDITKTVTVNLPKAEPVRNAGDVTIHMGGIVMNGVNDPKEFEANLIHAVNNSSRVKNAVSNNVLGPLTNGYNSLSGHMYTVH